MSPTPGARFKVKINYVKHFKHNFNYLLKFLLLPKLFSLKTIPTAIIVIFLAQHVALIIYNKFFILAALYKLYFTSMFSMWAYYLLYLVETQFKNIVKFLILYSLACSLFIFCSYPQLIC